MPLTIAINKVRSMSMMIVLFIAANIGLPHLFHLIPGGGIMFLPIYFFTAFAAVCYGKWAGVLTGVMSPLLGFLIFGMPKAMLLPDMVLKGVMLSVVIANLLAKAYSLKARVAAVPVAVVAAWLLTGILELMVVEYEMAFQDFFTGIPGLLFMTLAGWLALFFNKRIAS